MHASLIFVYRSLLVGLIGALSCVEISWAFAWMGFSLIVAVLLLLAAEAGNPASGTQRNYTAHQTGGEIEQSAHFTR